MRKRIDRPSGRFLFFSTVYLKKGQQAILYMEGVVFWGWNAPREARNGIGNPEKADTVRQNEDQGRAEG